MTIGSKLKFKVKLINTFRYKSISGMNHMLQMLRHELMLLVCAGIDITKKCQHLLDENVF
jgi:hypothetical protein